MTRTLVPLKRIPALSVAITLFAAPVASAQTPEVAPPKSAQSSAALLSPEAFARLMHSPKASPAPAAVVADPARPSLRSQATASVARQAQTTPAQAPQQKSYWSRNKWGIIIVSSLAVTVLVGILTLVPYG